MRIAPIFSWSCKCYVPESRSNQLVHFNESIKTEERRREKKRQGEKYLTGVTLDAFLPDRAAVPPAGITPARAQIGIFVTASTGS